MRPRDSESCLSTHGFATRSGNRSQGKALYFGIRICSYFWEHPEMTAGRRATMVFCHRDRGNTPGPAVLVVALFMSTVLGGCMTTGSTPSSPAQPPVAAVQPGPLAATASQPITAASASVPASGAPLWTTAPRAAAAPTASTLPSPSVMLSPLISPRRASKAEEPLLGGTLLTGHAAQVVPSMVDRDRPVARTARHANIIRRVPMRQWVGPR